MESDLNYPYLSVAKYAESVAEGKFDILATYDFRSDVVLSYYSWDEYDLARPVTPKTASGEIFAAISNCGNRERLDYLRALDGQGLRVHQYGRCNANQIFPSGSGDTRKQKFDTAAKYPFTNAMENGKTPYYVTEKLIDALVSGSIPIHMGVDDLRPFAPRAKSVLNTADYADAEAMAKAMKALLANATAYDEYLAWKIGGTTREFRATMDQSLVHSTCRLCIRVGDLHRWRHEGWASALDVDASQNPYAATNAVVLDEARAGGAQILRIRERGFFWFHLVALRSSTMEELRSEIGKRIGGYREFYRAQLVRKSAMEPLRSIETDAELRVLPPYTELEVVLFYY